MTGAPDVAPVSGGTTENPADVLYRPSAENDKDERPEREPVPVDPADAAIEAAIEATLAAAVERAGLLVAELAAVAPNEPDIEAAIAEAFAEPAGRLVVALALRDTFAAMTPDPTRPGALAL